MSARREHGDDALGQIAVVDEPQRLLGRLGEVALEPLTQRVLENLLVTQAAVVEQAPLSAGQEQLVRLVQERHFGLGEKSIAGRVHVDRRPPFLLAPAPRVYARSARVVTVTMSDQQRVEAVDAERAEFLIDLLEDVRT